MTTLAIYACPMAAHGGESIHAINSLRRALDYKRNPRTFAYMTTLAEQVGDGKWSVVHIETLSDEQIATASEIVLLWPDGNGFGWPSIVKHVLRTKQAAAPIHVLNGRRRFFPLSRKTSLAFGIRRAIARAWLGEAIYMLVGLAIGIPLAGWDRLRGHS